MKLYTSPTTPFGHKIAVLLREADLLDRVSVQMVSGTPLEAGSLPLAHNPLGKIPVLVAGANAGARGGDGGDDRGGCSYGL